MARIFISYRREDSRWAAGRIYDRLAEVLGRENVFLDVSDIEPGEDFVDKISQIVASCDVLLAIIGGDWISIADRSGARRLDNPNDLVRIEIEAALKRGIRVIPLLLDGVEMPEARQLPGDLASLARRNAREVSFGRFHADLDSLLRVLGKVLAVPETAAKGSPPPEAARSREPVPPPEEEEEWPVIATELPASIRLETLGGVATTLIAKGSPLPASASQVFSTAEDNQAAVSIRLVLGERERAAEDVAIGNFDLTEIPPAPRGVPQIEVEAAVDEALILTVTAKDLATGRKEVLDAIDLSKIEIPDDLLREVGEPPRATESPRDSPFDLSQVPPEPSLSERVKSPRFRDRVAEFMRSMKGSANGEAAQRELRLSLSAAEAGAGVERELDLGDGRKVRIKVPAGIRDGQTLRLRGLGAGGGHAADLYVRVAVRP